MISLPTALHSSVEPDTTSAVCLGQAMGACWPVRLPHWPASLSAGPWANAQQALSGWCTTAG